MPIHVYRCKGDHVVVQSTSSDLIPDLKHAVVMAKCRYSLVFPSSRKKPQHLSGVFRKYGFSISNHLVLSFCCLHPCVVVLQIIPFGFFCFLRLQELIDVVFPSLSRSSHWLALYLLLRPGLHFAAFFDHLVSGCEAILIASLHFIFLCVVIQQGILAFLIFSSASLALLFHLFNPILFFNCP